MSPFIQLKMNDNFAIWKNELFRKYRSNRFDSIKKIQQMLFRFDKNTTFSQYFSRKINLLRNANVINETLIVHYLWKNLNAQLALIISIRKNNDTVNSFNKKIKTNEIVVKKVNDLVKKSRFQFSTFQLNISTTNQFNIQFKFVSSTSRIQRLLNNYQKTTSVEMSSTQFRSINFFQFRLQSWPINNDNKKTSLLNKSNNKIFNFKSRTFRSCRHCKKNHYDNVCSTQKIMLTKMKNEKKRNVQYDRIKRHWSENSANTEVHSNRKCSKSKKKLKKKTLTNNRALSIFISNLIVHTLFSITQNSDHLLSSIISNLSMNHTTTLLFNLNINTAKNRFLLNQQFFDRIDSSSSIDRSSLLNYRSSSSYRINILYNNVTCIAYSSKKISHDVCIDTNFEFILISNSCAQIFYSEVENYLMFDNKRLRCIDIDTKSIIFIKCVDISIRFKTFNKIFVTINTTIHIVLELKCDMILSVFTLKSHDIIISWSFD